MPKIYVTGDDDTGRLDKIFEDAVRYMLDGIYQIAECIPRAQNPPEVVEENAKVADVVVVLLPLDDDPKAIGPCAEAGIRGALAGGRPVFVVAPLKRCSMLCGDLIDQAIALGPAAEAFVAQAKVELVGPRGPIAVPATAVSPNFMNPFGAIVDAHAAEEFPKHEPGCHLARAAGATSPVECGHGFDVCPSCDRCSCAKPAAQA